MFSSDTVETTGRYIVVLPEEEDLSAGVRALEQVAGIHRTARALDTLHETASTLADLDAVVCTTIGVAIVTATPDQAVAIQHAADDRDIPILSIEPERVYYAANQFAGNQDYVQGYRDGVNDFADRFLNTEEVLPASHTTAPTTTPFNESQTTWGLQATKVTTSRYSGRGIKVAVLDTELDLSHPDFAGRSIMAESFVRRPASTSPLQSVQDGNGHGTHCTGIACGPLNPRFSRLPRYGVAYNADLYFGKVLDNTFFGRGLTGEIARGIDWAVSSGCHIISMSLASEVRSGDAPDLYYENRVAQRALQRGCLMIAAAGNFSDRRQGKLMAVGNPAASPSILAVGALDPSLTVANFSNAGLNTGGGMVDIAAPGVDIYASVPYDEPFPNSRRRFGSSRRYLRISGTSQATPFVAGIAALYAEATGKRGRDLWQVLINNAKNLGLPATDVGAGLVQAP